MSTVKVDTIKPVTSGAALSLQGDSGGSAVDCLNIDSSGDIDFTGNTDAKIKLPSEGGIYGSNGSTLVLTESGGAVTLDNVALGSSAVLLPFIKNQGDVAGTISESNATLQFGGTTSDNGMVYLGRQLLAASSTLTLATPTAFHASSCIFCGKNRSTTNAANIDTQADVRATGDSMSFTAANTLTFVNSSGYTAYFYYALLRFK
jgi:hypothetical protein